MAEFTYKALNAAGKEVKGNVTAGSKEEALSAVKAKSLTPVSVETATALNKEMSLSFGGKVKPKDLSVFCRQMSSVLSAGVQMSEALEMLSEQTENKKLAAAITGCKKKISGGQSISESMMEYKCFEGIFATMIGAGESSGNLEMSFDRLGERYEKDTKTKAMISKATIYPIMVGIVAVVVVTVMMMFVVPKFQDILGQIGGEMPGITKMIIALSDFIKTKFLYIIVAVVVIVVGLKYFKKTDVGKHIFGTIGIKVPLLGPLTVKSACSNTARTLSTLLASGLSMMESLEITANTMTNVLFKDALMQVKKDVAVGVPLSEAMHNTKVFPAMLCHMARIGEETGTLEQMFAKTADYYDQEVAAATEKVMAAMEPMIIVVLAGVVGTIVIALMLPMISMYGNMDSV